MEDTKNDLTRTKVVTLNDRNYPIWKIVISAILKAKALWSFIIAKHDTADAALCMKSEEAKAVMYGAMDTTQILATGECETAYDLWTKIRENHEGTAEDRKNNALSNFLGFKYQKNESTTAYIARFEMALTRLVSTDHRIEENTKMWVFKNSLSGTLKDKVDLWLIANKDGKVKDLISRLKNDSHSDRKTEELVALYGAKDAKSNDRQANANKMYKNKTYNSQTSTNNKKGFKNNYKQQGDNNKKGMSEMVCHSCGEKGHGWRNCLKQKEETKRKKKFATNNNRKKDGKAYTAYALQSLTGDDLENLPIEEVESMPSKIETKWEQQQQQQQHHCR